MVVGVLYGIVSDLSDGLYNPEPDYLRRNQISGLHFCHSSEVSKYDVHVEDRPLPILL